MSNINRPESTSPLGKVSDLQESLEAYFKAAVQLFLEFSWTYDFKATDILADNVRDKVPLLFQDFFRSLHDSQLEQQFRDILHLEENTSWPPEVRKFIVGCKHLRNLSEEIKKSSILGITAPSVSPCEQVKLPKKWSAKKYFEVIHVGNFVGEMSRREGCDVAVDIGSGLGYLSSHLANHFNIPVIGIESVPSRVKTARETYLSSPTSASQTFVCLQITQNISRELNLNPHLLDKRRVCLTALHACGDLTPWSLKHFLSSIACHCIAVAPCCYHKMEVNDCNFPMSISLQTELEKVFTIKNKEAAINFLKNPWMWRLACQRSGSKFLDDIEKDTRNLFFRALLEKFVIQENLKLIRTKRNLQDSKFTTFGEYLDKMIGPNGGFRLVKGDENLPPDHAELANVFTKLTSLHDQLNSWSPLITGILAMQGALQAIAEDLILLDRLSFLAESELVERCGLVRVIPEDVSPRGMVLFGVKKNSE